MNYEMGGTILRKTVKENDLVLTMNANMKVSELCSIAASKGNQVLGMIRRHITYKDKSVIVPLYNAIVRPHLEYCIQACSPYIRKDIISPFSPFLTISLCRAGQYLSHPVFSVVCHVFSQSVFLHVSLYVVPPSLSRSASAPSPRYL